MSWKQRVGRVIIAVWLSHWIILIIAFLLLTAGLVIYPDWITENNSVIRNLLLFLWTYIKSTVVVLVIGFMVISLGHWMIELWQWATKERV